MTGRRVSDEERRRTSAEVRKLQLQAKGLGRRAVHREQRERPWLIPLIGFLIGTVAVLIAVVAVCLAHDPDPVRPVAITTPAPSASDQERLVRDARKLQPLAESKAGDRVLYRGDVCYWIDGDQKQATITCGSKLEMVVATGALTPIEQRD